MNTFKISREENPFLEFQKNFNKSRKYEMTKFEKSVFKIFDKSRKYEMKKNLFSKFLKSFIAYLLFESIPSLFLLPDALRFDDQILVLLVL